MTDHATRTVERHCDVAVVGGSAAGLAAALQLARQRRSVIVVDAGEPRNAPAAHMHGFLGREGSPPSDLTVVGREEVRGYGAEVLAGRVSRVTGTDDARFRVDVAGDHSIVARRVLAATGLVDELPDIDGLAQHWGRDVIHCPFCHGYEVRDRRIVQVLTHPMGLHPATLFRQLTADLTIVVHDPAGVDDADVLALEAAGVAVVRERVRRIVTGDGARVAAVELSDGARLDAEAIVVGPRFRVRSEPFGPLGLRPSPHPSGLGDFLETDANGATAVPGVYAAGNVTDPSQQVLHAAAHGSRVGAMISASLAEEDVRLAVRAAPNRADWEHRYSGDRVWSGNPNGTLVAEVADLPPGRALDVGAGEGGDAVWLAEHGWTVTANDISQRALERIGAEAVRRGLDVRCLHADANALRPFEPAAFDLVSAMYASIPRTPDGRGIRNLADAVAPGGMLLIVGHDLEPMRAPVDISATTRMFDPDAYVRVDDFAAALADDPEWDIEVHEERPRPVGAASAGHHVTDVVLRAHRGPEGAPGGHAPTSVARGPASASTCAMEDVVHPGDLDRHIMRDLGFGVVPAGDEMHGSAQVVPEMNVPGTESLRTSILAAWADVVSGHVAIGLFDPGVPVTLDLDVHLHRPPVGCAEVRMTARVQKSGRSVSVLRIAIEDGDGEALGFGHATFMAAPNPSLRMPTVVRDEALLRPHPPRLDVPYAERAGCERTGAGAAEIPMRPDGLNASGTLNGGLLALVVEEAVLAGAPPGTTLSSMALRFAQPVRVGPATARADLTHGLADVVVRDGGRDDRLAVIATTRAFA